VDAIEVFTHIIRSPINTTAERNSNGVLVANFVVPVIPGIGEMLTFNIGESGQQELTKALTGGLHIGKPEDIPGA
jgi:hypothetical protein